MKADRHEYTFAEGSRELTLLRLYANGLTDEQAAAVMRYKPGTIRNWGVEMRFHLGARTRAHAVGIGFRAGWLTGADVTS